MGKLFAYLDDSIASLGLAHGLLATLARAIDVASGGTCRLFKYYFVAQPVPGTAPVAPQRASTTRIYRARAGDGIIGQFPRPAENIAGRFAAGAVCIVAERAGKLVGFIW